MFRQKKSLQIFNHIITCDNKSKENGGGRYV